MYYLLSVAIAVIINNMSYIKKEYNLTKQQEK